MLIKQYSIIINIINYICYIINLLYIMIYKRTIKTKNKLAKITPIFDNNDIEIGINNFDYHYNIEYNHDNQNYYIKNFIKIKTN